MKIKTGDKVIAVSGKDKGKQGKVVQIFQKEEKASVDGINLMVKHLRPRAQGQKGQKVQFPAPIHISNLLLICSKCGKPTRVGKKITEDKRYVRICKKCKEII